MIQVVLPAYNEAVSLNRLLFRLSETFKRERLEYNVYVVDDGSTDNTAQIVKNYAKKDPHVRLISQIKNFGLAEAINTGFRIAIKRSKENDILITMDADNTHLPGLILRMVRLIYEGHDIVISSRFVTGARIRGVPVVRRFLSRAASIIFRLLFPIQGVRDYTCGYRAYRMEIIQQGISTYKDQFVSEKGFACMVDILLKLRRFDPLCTEVPMILRYDQKKGKSKMNVPRTVKESLALIGRYLIEPVS